MNSIAFTYYSIILLNSYCQNESLIKAIEFYSNANIKSSFRLSVIFIFTFKI